MLKDMDLRNEKEIEAKKIQFSSHIVQIFSQMINRNVAQSWLFFKRNAEKSN